ncbi:MAG: hypothetical protein JSW16_06080 [Dehalococcoidales bacterium]|nr:MAG: hypothetical protein JSW16_06080 [Dehalococcoidales bacterium]
MKNVFILGAGASKTAGGPLMAEFLEKAEDLLRRGVIKDNEIKESFQDVFSARTELNAIYTKSYLDIDNIESLFGAIEMAQVIGKFGERTMEEIIKLRESIITLIVHTLERSISFPVRNGQVFPTEHHNAFVKMLQETENREEGEGNEFTIITFNYDLTMDVALSLNQMKFDYCLEEGKETNKVKYLKLHGSINWGLCRQCNKIIPLSISEVNFNTYPGHTKNANYNFSSWLKERKHCEAGYYEHPVLVPPTWNKTAHNNQINNVWRKVAKELSQAENIFIIGYSFPTSDLFFRYLYALGSVSSMRIRRFWVFNPDPTGEVKNNFTSLIGRGIENKYQFYNESFETSIQQIGKALRRY